MQLLTASGIVRGSRRSRYMAWLAGRIQSGAWTGAWTVKLAWDQARESVLDTRALSACRRLGYLQGVGERSARRLEDAA